MLQAHGMGPVHAGCVASRAARPGSDDASTGAPLMPALPPAGGSAATSAHAPSAADGPARAAARSRARRSPPGPEAITRPWRHPRRMWSRAARPWRRWTQARTGRKCPRDQAVPPAASRSAVSERQGTRGTKSAATARHAGGAAARRRPTASMHRRPRSATRRVSTVKKALVGKGLESPPSRGHANPGAAPIRPQRPGQRTITAGGVPPARARRGAPGGRRGPRRRAPGWRRTG